MLIATIVLAALAQAAPAAPGKVELAGVVVDAQGHPAAGAEVWLSTLHQVRGKFPTLGRTVTDAQGRFRHEVVSRDPKYEIWTLWAFREGTSIGVQAAGPTEDLPRPGTPLRLTLGPLQSSFVRVLDAAGRPVEGARVRLVYYPLSVAKPLGMRISYSLPIPREIGDRIAARTDAQGNVEVTGLPNGGVGLILVESRAGGSQLIGPTDQQEARWIARLAPTGRLVGHVDGPDPGRARGIAIEAFTTLNRPGHNRFETEGRAEITIDESGRFEVPALAVGKLRIEYWPRDATYQSELVASDLAIEAGKTIEVTISLPGGGGALRTVAGRVIDRRGQPVPGAEVFQSGDGPRRTRTTTDAQGLFRLDGIEARPAFALARKGGFRFHGQAIGEGNEPVTLTLIRTDEKPEPLRTQPPPLPHREELALARRVLGAYADRVLKEGELDEKVPTIEVLARVDPDRALAEAESGKYPDPFYNDMFRMRVMEGMARDDPEAAAEIAESGRMPMLRAMAYVVISTALDPTPQNRARRLALLDQALLQARSVKEGDKRLANLAQIADQWLELGETDRATRLLREAEKEARELPNAAFAGYARGVFAEELAQIDLPAALAMIKDLSDPREFDRHHGNIAHELAGKDPAAAERVLAMVRDQRQRDSLAIRVCYRMAPVDLARARRIAGAIRHHLMRPYALGMMAQALAHAEKTRPDAANLLAAAFDDLAASVEAGQDEFNNMEGAAVMAASLLPVAESIDPTLVPEYLWRSLSFRRPTTGPADNPAQALWLDQAASALAMRIARYDQPTARSLIEPVARRVIADPEKIGAQIGREAIVALGVVNPQRAVSGLDGLPDGPPRSLQRQTRNRARRDLAAVLARPADQRWKYLQWQYFHAWVPDVEDIVPPF